MYNNKIYIIYNKIIKIYVINNKMYNKIINSLQNLHSLKDPSIIQY